MATLSVIRLLSQASPSGTLHTTLFSLPPMLCRLWVRNVAGRSSPYLWASPKGHCPDGLHAQLRQRHVEGCEGHCPLWGWERPMSGFGSAEARPRSSSAWGAGGAMRG